MKRIMAYEAMWALCFYSILEEYSRGVQMYITQENIPKSSQEHLTNE